MIDSLARKLALRRSAPDNITVSLPGAEENDFYRIYLEIPEIKYDMLCQSESERGIDGYLWIDKTDGSSATLLKENLKNYKWNLRFEHYYKGRVHEYSSGASYLFNTLFSRHKFARRKNNISQAMFNKKKLVRLERIELLQRIFDNTLENPDYSISPFSVGTELYSKRWYLHPEQRNTRKYYQLLLDSLRSTDDLEKNDDAYKLSPHALFTLSEYAREEQRHNDNQNGAKKTRSLTIAIIVLGLLNLAFHFGKWAYEQKIFISDTTVNIEAPDKALDETSVEQQK